MMLIKNRIWWVVRAERMNSILGLHCSMLCWIISFIENWSSSLTRVLTSSIVFLLSCVQQIIVIIFLTTCWRGPWVSFWIYLFHLILLGLAGILHHHHLWRVYDWPLGDVILEIIRRWATFHSLSLYVLIVKLYSRHYSLFFFFL